ncbi:GNAT family N-acetyltransferase [Streptomyces sp. NPDC048442]|uniref:GNAT family N-acetyltransferase n=1 Tax=Streptomyces sp. NPDC048442 TaxID=3154823 RepID=UPI0034401E4A
MRLEAEIEKAHELLACVPGLRVVAAEESVRFRGFELVSLLELREGEVLEAGTLGARGEARARERLGVREWGGDRWEEFHRGYWITGPDGSPIGTLTVDTMPRGGNMLGLGSLYVRPGMRGRGIAGAVLDAVYAAVCAAGLNGIRLSTDWLWQAPVRYYLARRMRVAMWKHDLVFERSRHRAPYEVRSTAGEFTYFVRRDGRLRPVLRAGRDGGLLVLDELPGALRTDVDERRARWDLMDEVGTLALHLAVAGHPLVRGAEEWEAAWEHSDFGAPEGLAYKIFHWEQYARRKGYAMRGPGLVLDARLLKPSWMGEGEGMVRG